jgi:hypothetical protein
MSTAAIPAFLLARRVVDERRALVAAALAVAVPSLAYTGTLMTETVFYPLFTLAAYLLVVTLERPTVTRQLALVAVCAAAYLTRAQAVTLVAAVVTAPVLMRRARQFAPLYALVGGAAAAALVAATVRNGSPAAVLGAYRVVAERGYGAADVVRYAAYHVAELDLYLGVAPFAALLALWLAWPAAERAFVAASLSLTVWLVVTVAAFASLPGVHQLLERDLFYVAPLAFTALLAVRPARHPRALAAGAVAALAPAAISVDRFLSDTLAGAPWTWVHDRTGSATTVRVLAVLAAAAAVALWFALARRLVLALVVGVYLAGATAVALAGRHGIERASRAALAGGIGTKHTDWIDRAVGRDADVAFVWSAELTPYMLWENEFFNRSVGPVYSLRAAAPGGLPERPVRVLADGRLVGAGSPRYVLAGGGVDLAGTVVAEDRATGLRLFRADRPLVVLTRVTGVDDDAWAGRRVTYRRARCRGGTLAVQLQTDVRLFHSAQTVVARSGTAVARARIEPAAEATLRIPLRPVGGTCTVVFTAARTVVPAQVDPASSDTRRLGARFLRFELTGR